MGRIVFLLEALEQRSPTFLAPGTGFVEDNFSMDQRAGDGFGMIQAHYICLIKYVNFNDNFTSYLVSKMFF